MKGEMAMVGEETMMFRFGTEESKAENIIRSTCSSMEKKGYNPINSWLVIC